MKNIGAVNAQKLRDAGVADADALRALGSKQAWLKVRESGVDSGLCLAALLGFEGAIRGIPKKQLPQAAKDELRHFFNHCEKGK